MSQDTSDEVTMCLCGAKPHVRCALVAAPARLWSELRSQLLEPAIVRANTAHRQAHGLHRLVTPTV
eukprot:scaffold32280_cov30-Phaeocystis_antarctica.AAC.1